MATLFNIAAGAVAGAGAIVYGFPVAVGVIGYTAGGIAAGSTAAWMMSLSGAATQAGSVVAVAQSIGATGAVSSSTAALGAVLGGVAAAIRNE